MTATIRNHYIRHYRTFHLPIPMLYQLNFPSSLVNVGFIVCLLCCTGSNPMITSQNNATTSINNRTYIASLTSSLRSSTEPIVTQETNIVGHTVASLESSKSQDNGIHENVSKLESSLKEARKNTIKTRQQKINDDTKVMIPLLDTGRNVTMKKDVVLETNYHLNTVIKNKTRNDSATSNNSNRLANSSSPGFQLRNSSYAVHVRQLLKVLKTNQLLPNTSISDSDFQKVYKTKLYPPINVLNQISKASAEETDQPQKSSIAKFLEEPELGQSWYNRNGPTPTFHDSQRNGTTYNTRLGASVFLNCQVTALEKDLVSWFKAGSSSGMSLPTLLTVGFRPPYASENRFMLDFLPPHNYRLKIDNVQWRYLVKYICQLAVHTPSFLGSRVRVIRPLVHLLDSEMNPVADLDYDVGTRIEKVCRVKRPPLYHVSVQWEVQRLHPYPSGMLS